MTDQTSPELSNQTSADWLIALWLVFLLGALCGLFFLHYRPDWAALVSTAIEVEPAIMVWGFSATALFSLLALFWVVQRQTIRRGGLHLHRARWAEATLSRLREAIQAACDEAAIAQWRVGNNVQTQAIKHLAQEIPTMSDAISKISDSVTTSAEGVRHFAETAQKGASALQSTITGINDTRSQIQEAADRLKQLAQSTAQLDATVHLIRDVTEQAGVVSLNGYLRADNVTGQTDAAEATEEMQRLTDRASRGAGETATRVQVIQSDAESIIASLELTAGHAAAGTALADEAIRALTEIESASRELLAFIDQTTSGAASEAARAQTASEKVGELRAAAEQSGVSASRITAAIEKLRVESASTSGSPKF